MTTVQVATRVPKEIKEQAALITSQYGLALSDVMRMFLTRIAKEKRIGLDISKPSISNFDELHPEYQDFIDDVSEIYTHEPR